MAESDWSFSAVLGWSWRTIEGDIFAVSPPFAGAATADSLGLGTSSEPQAAFGVRWKRLSVDLVYLPSKFTGEGFLVQGLDIGTGPPIATTTPIASDMEVIMTLANIAYDLLKPPDLDPGVGVGIGKVELDITMQPEQGPGVTIDGQVPFGYLTCTFAKHWTRWSGIFTLQGLSVSENDAGVRYKSANLAGTHRFLSRGRFGLEAVAGYHLVDFQFEFDDQGSGARTSTDFRLTGPYLALRATW